MDSSNTLPDNPRGTGFVNLQQYLNANQNNNLDPYIGGQLQNESGNLQNQLQQNQNQFQTDLSKQNQTLQDNQNEVDQVLANPVAATPDQIQDFSKFRTDQPYTGVKDLKNYNDLYGQAQNLTDLGNSLQNGNVQNLLGRYFSGNQYTTGDQNFDSMLLGSAPNIRQGITSLNQVAPSQISSIRAGDQGLAQQAANNQNNFTSNVQQQLGLTPQGVYDPNSKTGALQQFVNPIQSQLTKDQQLQKDIQPQILDQLQNRGDINKIDPTAIKALGLNNLIGWNGIGQYLNNPSGYNPNDPGFFPGVPNITHGPYSDPGLRVSPYAYDTYGVNPLKYYTAATPVTANSIVTPDQAAQYAALVNLSGVNPNLITLSGNQQTLSPSGQPEGGYTADPKTAYGAMSDPNNLFGKFDLSGFQKDVTAQQQNLAPLLQKYANDINGINNTVNSPTDANAYWTQQAQQDLNNLNNTNPNWNNYINVTNPGSGQQIDPALSGNIFHPIPQPNVPNLVQG